MIPNEGLQAVRLVLVAACALIDADGRVLIAERPAGRAMAGLWEFPGGKLEAGERPEQTLVRELKVRLGIGRGRDRVLTCDLTKDYVAINGDYRS